MKIKSKSKDLIILEGYLNLNNYEYSHNIEYDVFSVRKTNQNNPSLIGKCIIEKSHFGEYHFCTINIPKNTIIFAWLDYSEIFKEIDMIFNFEAEGKVYNNALNLEDFHLTLAKENELKIKLTMLSAIANGNN